MLSRTPTRRSVLCALAGSTVLAGCLGDDGDDDQADTGADDQTDTEDEGGAENGGTGATVQVSTHSEHGDILVDPEGSTLYVTDADEQGSGESSCYGDCADAWPPLTVDGEPTAGTDVAVDLTTLEREGGATQIVADGLPLYYFAQDEEPGDAAGQGVNDTWWVVAPDGTPVRDDDEEGGGIGY